MRVLLVLSLFSPLASADVYRCTINGKTVYQDKPCDNAQLVDNYNALPPDPIEHQRAKQRAAKDRSDLAKKEFKRQMDEASSSITIQRRATSGGLYRP
ncbi:MAG: DUF4124 domain-containing protein [Pigmentiphaga sp.]